jgi:hypothetical protein
MSPYKQPATGKVRERNSGSRNRRHHHGISAGGNQYNFASPLGVS